MSSRQGSIFAIRASSESRISSPPLSSSGSDDRNDRPSTLPPNNFRFSCSRRSSGSSELMYRTAPLTAWYLPRNSPPVATAMPICRVTRLFPALGRPESMVNPSPRKSTITHRFGGMVLSQSCLAVYTPLLFVVIALYLQIVDPCVEVTDVVALGATVAHAWQLPLVGHHADCGLGLANVLASLLWGRAKAFEHLGPQRKRVTYTGGSPALHQRPIQDAESQYWSYLSRGNRLPSGNQVLCIRFLTVCNGVAHLHKLPAATRRRASSMMASAQSSESSSESSRISTFTWIPRPIKRVDRLPQKSSGAATPMQRCGIPATKGRNLLPSVLHAFRPFRWVRPNHSPIAAGIAGGPTTR